MAQETLPDRPPASGPADPDGAPGTAGRPGRAARLGRRLRRFLRTGGRAGWPRTLVVIGAGLALCSAFPPFDLTPLAFAAVAALTLAIRGQAARTGGWLGFLAGAAFFLPALDGLIPVGPDAWAVLSLVEALYFVPMGAAIALVTRLPGWPLWTAGLWVAQEALRGRAPFGGFPWARLAFSQTATPLTPYASAGGAPLVTFLTALVGGLLAFAALAVWRLRPSRRNAPDAAQGAERPEAAGPDARETAGETTASAPRAPGRRRAAASAALALAVAAAVTGAGALIPTPADGPHVTVAVIQGNVPRLGLDFLGQRKAVLNNHVKATHELAAEIRARKVARPQLVVWPENSSDLDPYTEPDAYRAIDGAVRDVGVPVLVGALTDTPDRKKVENRGIVWDPATGPGNYYVKRHPVPFGEYLPFRDVLTKLIKRFALIPRDFAKGKRSGVMRLGPVDIGDVICFEVAYDKEVRDAARGRILVVQTNNATYGRTSLPPQQIAMSRLRAVEHGRTILVAATSGISAIVAPDGRMIDRSREFVPDIQVASVPERTERTLSDRLGEWPEWALVALGIGALCAAAWATARKNEEN
ncbi:apolipoprotein N-acyltransferase [Actinomadura opuntiae]|uniref:apolipoprotein N-acyltransferase n=1 Tax=Actinomadura sp. OS1-43 TaxID=604315 RepID=UPI00255AD89F|nr:apolipoprotein N-acyltransferase [Actinomadura sp. OS1-43]MDL4822022.1 apolipoprotein N-acyltransferase [Actinomadura sp. OS1-43]